ncbi:pilin [Zoogloeaceae bacterium G21618-S1]|nr:pilin [Zoogloeaceae bacterium G21618-S1]
MSEGLVGASAAKVNVQDVLSSGNPSSDANGYALGYTAPAASRNVASIVIAPNTGEITITTTAAAGGGTLTMTPNAPAGTALPAAAGATFTPPAQSVAWRCAAVGAAPGLFVGVTGGSLAARFAPAECK